MSPAGPAPTIATWLRSFILFSQLGCRRIASYAKRSAIDKTTGPLPARRNRAGSCLTFVPGANVVAALLHDGAGIAGRGVTAARAVGR
jgi:hypothetical protein